MIKMISRQPVRMMLIVALGLSMSLMTLGCQQDNIQAPQVIRTDPLAGGYPQHVALNGLEKVVVVSKAIVEPATKDRPMRVTVPLRSVVDGQLRTQYQFIFLDGKGRPVKSHRENWSYQVLADHAQVFLEGAALDTDAVDWRLEVRPAK